MKYVGMCAVIATCTMILGSGYAAATEKPVLVGWGIDGANLDTFMEQAADVGFDILITGSNDQEFLQRAVEAGGRHNIEIFSTIAPMNSLARLWAQRYPERPVPWQVMSEDEEAAFKFITAGDNMYLIPFQFGGEPVLTHEVLSYRIVCHGNREAWELFKPVIDTIAAVPGLGGLALDGFGYQNYHSCHCAACQEQLAEFAANNPELSPEQASEVFFREMLVDSINTLAEYARSRRADIKTLIHIWPVFTPLPLYGNLLDVDYCGQTAAWYFPWPEEKIAAYSRIIAERAAEYHPRQQGEAMMGYYDRPGRFPVKDAARVDMELRTMLENGSRRIQVCSSIDVVKNAEIAEVFKRYFK